MIWCPECRYIFDGDDINCPMCAHPLEELPEGAVEEAAEPEAPVWPLRPDGEPEEAVPAALLADLDCAPALAQSLLGAYGIPSLLRYPEMGDVGHLYFGFSITGAELFVPAGRVEEAKALLDKADRA